MQEQTQQTNEFLTSPNTFNPMPYIGELFEAIDELIVECAEANNADLTQLKRLVAAHAAGDNLTELDLDFSKVGEKKSSQ